MQNRERIIQEVAKELGIPQKKVQEVVSSQTGLVRKAMQNKEATSVYLRKVGTFISAPVRQHIKQVRLEARLAKQSTKVEEVNNEEPLYFN
jgi:predicted transcriptional regulator